MERCIKDLVTKKAHNIVFLALTVPDLCNRFADGSRLALRFLTRVDSLEFIDFVLMSPKK